MDTRYHQGIVFTIYVSIDTIAGRIVDLGRGALMAKLDLKSAYRHILVHPGDKWLLGVDWNGMLHDDSTLPTLCPSDI